MKIINKMTGRTDKANSMMDMLNVLFERFSFAKINIIIAIATKTRK